ncbi:hypothetical protein L914_07689 [Phytophthora nicotianae]|uniref:Uncharacterized protein n=1 Tax=Phytophthora nicotianae TaxID=4792 RepID=W2NG31_PHYNI|nr:hypothetical protein L914_07689 [Phytophthora nicotianae]
MGMNAVEAQGSRHRRPVVTQVSSIALVMLHISGERDARLMTWLNSVNQYASSYWSCIIQLAADTMNELSVASYVCNAKNCRRLFSAFLQFFILSFCSYLFFFGILKRPSM